MNKNRHTALLKIIAAQSLLVFIAFLVVSISTIHLHILPDGRQIIHSHVIQPKGNSNTNEKGSGHTHTQSEFNFYSLFSLDKIKITYNGFLLLICFALLLTILIKEVSTHRTVILHSNSLRAPPVFNR